jgi:hypothetical protein
VPFVTLVVVAPWPPCELELPLFVELWPVEVPPWAVAFSAPQLRSGAVHASRDIARDGTKVHSTVTLVTGTQEKTRMARLRG